MLSDYVRVVARRWWLALLPLVVVLAVTLASYRPPASTFQVTLRFAAGLPPERTPSVYNYDRQYVWLASEYTANALSDIVRTNLFAQNVANRVSAQGLSITADQLQGALASEQKHSVVYVYLTWPDATQIVRIGDAINAELVEHGTSYWQQLSETNAAPVVSLDRPAPAQVAVSLRDRFDLPIRVLLAF